MGCVFFGEVLEYHKKMSKSFCVQEKFREGVLLVFLKVFGMKELCVTWVSRLFIESFCFLVPKVFVELNFWCLRVLACAWHKLHLLAPK